MLRTIPPYPINSNPNDPSGIDIALNHKPDLTPDQQYQLGLKYYFGERFLIMYGSKKSPMIQSIPGYQVCC